MFFFVKHLFFKIDLWVNLFFPPLTRELDGRELKKSSLSQLHLPYMVPTVHKDSFCPQHRERRLTEQRSDGAWPAGAWPPGRRPPLERGHQGAMGSITGALRLQASGAAGRGARRRFMQAWRARQPGCYAAGASLAQGEATVGWGWEGGLPEGAPLWGRDLP